MKISKSAPSLRTILVIVVATLFVLNIVSCYRDQTDTPQTTSPAFSGSAAERACTGGLCEITVFSNQEMTIEFCGNITPYTSTCDFGCDPNNDVYYGAYIPANTSYSNVCIAPSGSVCIRNAPTATSSITLDVKIGSTSIPVTVTLAPGQSRCFHTNSTCSVTNTGCS